MSAGEKQWITKVSRVFSVIFHPVFIPLYGLLLIYSSPTLLSFIPARLKWTIFLMVLANNVVLPVSLAAILTMRGAIKTFNARDRNERVVLLTFALLMYTITAILFLRIQVPNLFRAYFISIAFVTLVTLIITSVYRISLHAAGIGGLLALLVFMIMLFDIRSAWQLVTVILIGGGVMSSRLYLDDHTPTETWTGLFAGAGVMAVTLFILLK